MIGLDWAPGRGPRWNLISLTEVLLVIYFLLILSIFISFIYLGHSYLYLKGDSYYDYCKTKLLKILTKIIIET